MCIDSVSIVLIFSGIQQELQVENPLTAHILGVGYGFVVRR